MSQVVVAFGHKKRVGKDTASRLLKAHLERLKPGIRVREVSFARKLKEMAHSLWGWAGLQGPDFYDVPENEHLREVILPLLGKTPRTLWIELGNKVREIYEDTWIRIALLGYDDADVITVRDLRYPNEASGVEYADGLRIKVTNSRVPMSDDVADNALNGYTKWTHNLPNEGTTENLNDLLLPIALAALNKL
jgi:hypothetical protein